MKSSVIVGIPSCLLLSLVATSNASSFEVTSLTSDNYETATDGKTVFIKFFAPWCTHCNRLAPDWVKLAEEWEESEVGLVVEVDCTVEESATLCKYHDIRSFPTLKYGDPNDLHDFVGPRDFEALSEFAKEHLIPLCSPTQLELCDITTKRKIEKYMSMSQSELAAMVVTEIEKMDQAKSTFQSEVEELQDRYKELEQERDRKIAEVREGEIGLIKSVARAMQLRISTSGSEEL